MSTLAEPASPMKTRVLFKGEVDLIKALGDRGSSFDLVIEPPARIEVFAQQLQRDPSKKEATSAITRAADEDIDVVVLSLAGELTRDLYQDDETGELVDSSDTDSRPHLRLAAPDFEGAAASVVEKLSASNDPLVVWFTASTYGEEKEPHTWFGGDRPFSVRANLLNLAVARLSQATGVCFVDADRLIAEMSAGSHVDGPFTYSKEASRRLGEEFDRILIETGRLLSLDEAPGSDSDE